MSDKQWFVRHGPEGRAVGPFAHRHTAVGWLELRGYRLKDEGATWKVYEVEVVSPDESPSAATSGERGTTLNAQEALKTTYGQGVAHGFETTLRLLLGETSEGTVGFLGPLTPECEAWARQALARLKA